MYSFIKGFHEFEFSKVMNGNSNFSKLPKFDHDYHNSNFRPKLKQSYTNSIIPYIYDDMTIVYAAISCIKSPAHRTAMKILHAFRNRLNFRKQIKFP